MRLPTLILLLALPLAACGKGDGGTSISVKDERGKTVASADGEGGQVKLDVPGFSGKIKLPRIKLDAGNFDLNGVHLYPGSTINSFDVQAGDNNDGGVRVVFTSPAQPATVRDWFADRLGKADFQVRPDGTGLIGTTDDKKPFRLTLDPQGNDKARGVIKIG